MMSLNRSLFYIVLSTVMISGTSWGAWAGWQYWQWKLENDSRYPVRAIMTKSLGGEPLRPSIVAEWLNLSVTKTMNLYRLNLNEAKKKIERQLPVKRAIVSRIPPSTLMVEIEMRRPIALVGERSNIGIDEEGNVFPLVPFYTPKKLPKIFVGHRNNFPLVVAVLKSLDKRGELGNVELVDAEKANALSFGERELVILSNGVFSRLDPAKWEDGLEKMFKLKHIEAKILDLRIQDLVLVTKKG